MYKPMIAGRRYMRILALGCLLFASVPLPPASAENAPNALAQGLIEATGLGTVDTTKTANRIQARLLAKRAAVVDAQRNLLEMVEGVRVTAGTTVKDAQLESDLIANRVKGLLQGAFTIDESIIEDGGEYLAEVKLGVCLNASVTNCRARPTLSQIIYQTLDKPADGQKFQAPGQADAVSGVTGLIVDATAVDFEPYFDVRLVTHQGKEVYGPGHFDMMSGEDWLHWARSVNSARDKVDLVGDNPLVVAAAGLTEDSRIVLQDEDAVRIFRANLDNDDFLSKGRVIFVVQ